MQSSRWQRNKLIAMASVGLMMGLGLVGCSNNNVEAPTQDGKISGDVEWWTNNLSKGFTPYLTNLISTFEDAHPDVKIKWVDVAPTDMSRKYLAAVASGSVPDAVNLSSAEIGAFRSTLADLNDYFSDKDLATYQPGLAKALKTDGKQYGVPWYNGGGLISYYRGSVMEKVGFSVDKPATSFDDTLELAQEVKSTTGTYGMNIAFLFTLPYYYGVPVLNADRTKAAFNTPEMVKVLTSLKKYYDSGALAPGTIAKDWHNYPQSLANKQIAFMPANWATDIGGLKQNAPEVYDDLIVAPGPTSPDGHAMLNGQQTYVIPAKSKNKPAAAEWIKFVTSAQGQLEFCKLVAIYPSTVATLKDSFFTASSGTTATDKARELVVSSLSGSGLDDVGSYGTSHDIELQDVFAEQIRAALSGTKTAEEALESAEEQWNKILG